MLFQREEVCGLFGDEELDGLIAFGLAQMSGRVDERMSGRPYQPPWLLAGRADFEGDARGELVLRPPRREHLRDHSTEAEIEQRNVDRLVVTALDPETNRFVFLEDNVAAVRLGSSDRPRPVALESEQVEGEPAFQVAVSIGILEGECLPVPGDGLEILHHRRLVAERLEGHEQIAGRTDSRPPGRIENARLRNWICRRHRRARAEQIDTRRRRGVRGHGLQERRHAQPVLESAERRLEAIGSHALHRQPEVTERVRGLESAGAWTDGAHSDFAEHQSLGSHHPDSRNPDVAD